MSWLLCALMLGLFNGSAALAAPVENFYAGKQLKLIVGTGTGGGYDIYGRFLARYFGRHIPGHPNIIVVNMPGASSISAANYLANVAPKDGTEMLMIVQTLPVVQVMGSAAVQFDLAKFNWIGNMSDSANVFIARHDAGMKTLADAQTRELTVGSTGPVSFAGMIPEIMNKSLGTRFKIVLGYDSGSALDLALERGEVDGRAGVQWSGLKATHPNWLRDKDIDVLFQIGLKKEPDLPDVPLLIDLARTDTERDVLRFYSSLVAFSRAVAVGPGVPPARVVTLRRAFDEAMHDPEALADVAKRGLEIRPLEGDKVQAIISDMVHTNPRILALKAF